MSDACHPTVVHYPRGDSQALCTEHFWVSERFDTPTLAWESAKTHERYPYSAVVLPDLAAVVDDLRSIEDPVQRILACETTLRAIRAELTAKVGAVRGQAVKQLLDDGQTLAAVAHLLADAGRKPVSRQRVFQMLREADE